MIKIYPIIKKGILLLSCLVFAFLYAGCHQEIITSNPDNNNNDDQYYNDIRIQSLLLVKGNPDIVKDCTPEFTIFTEKDEVKNMSFSGNGIDWSPWIPYAENYENFNIASGTYGTMRESGNKTIYIRFQDENGIVFPAGSQEPVVCNFKYKMQDLFSIKIEPSTTEVMKGGKASFQIKGYDIVLNEVPLDPALASWTKGCGVGELNPIVGLSTTYTAPDIAGVRDIAAHYGSLRVGAKIYISEK